MSVSVCVREYMCVCVPVFESSGWRRGRTEQSRREGETSVGATRRRLSVCACEDTHFVAARAVVAVAASRLGRQ